jgi:hypothetical protein
MKPTLLFLVKFICLTAPLVWLWQNGGLYVYHAFYSPIASAIYEWLGFEGIATPARDRYINLIPFLALMILTPNLSIRRRLIGTAVGLVILVLTHIAVNLTSIHEALRLPRWVSLAMDATPFFLWVVIANKFVGDFMMGRTAGTDANANAEGSAGSKGG